MKNFNTILKTPLPLNISLMWNFGSILGMCMMIQLISGILLSMNYCPNITLAFMSINNIMKNIEYGWLIRLIHMNGASMFFIFLYLHMWRNIYYNSHKFKYTFLIGTLIYLMTMTTAFMGYILPWGQMSFWGATVITNLISAIPWIGKILVEWIWGGFTINNATLNRFYSMHFILPFLLIMLIIIHLNFLHNTGSSNPLGTNSNMNKIYFHPYFTIKDFIMFMIIMKLFLLICFLNPYMLNDPENFIMANPMTTPMHIQPEWYFLYSYSILRTIPNKLGGVTMLLLSILILTILPFLNINKYQMNHFNPINKYMFWMFINIFLMLTWIGTMPINYPYTMISKLLTSMYFLYFMSLKFINKFWNNIMI